MKPTERLKRDNLLIDYILQHKGKNNAVHASEIAGGFFWARNMAEIKEFIDHLQKRIDGLQEHIEHLKNFIME